MRNPRIKDLTGQNFGLWTVLRQNGNTKTGAALWLCYCKCGKHKTVIGSDLRSGKSLSCGCLQRKAAGKNLTTHGKSKTPMYRKWKAMHGRVSKSGGYYIKGIAVCPEWADFLTFESWALSNGYSDDLSLDRIDNLKGYSPENCRWVERSYQSVNRDFVRLSPSGEPWYQVARRNGIRTQLFHGRVHDGWTDEQAATIPKGGRRKNYA